LTPTPISQTVSPVLARPTPTAGNTAPGSPDGGGAAGQQGTLSGTDGAIVGIVVGILAVIAVVAVAAAFCRRRPDDEEPMPPASDYAPLATSS
jgi:hypothetical protein